MSPTLKHVKILFANKAVREMAAIPKGEKNRRKALLENHSKRPAGHLLLLPS